MTDAEWKLFYPYFTPNECGRQMNLDFMVKVLRFRKTLNCKMIVICGADTSGHEDGSYHYIGEALDFWVPIVSPRLVMRLIDSSGLFSGAGFYPWGAHKSFHIDNRPPERYQRWVSKKPKDYDYLLVGV
jgi:hypothetical protein